MLEVLRRLAGGPVSADSRLEADLGLDSLAIAELAAILRAESGNRVDLAGQLAELELDELIGLTAGRLADLVTTRVTT